MRVLFWRALNTTGIFMKKGRARCGGCGVNAPRICVSRAIPRLPGGVWLLVWVCVVGFFVVSRSLCSRSRSRSLTRWMCLCLWCASRFGRPSRSIWSAARRLHRSPGPPAITVGYTVGLTRVTLIGRLTAIGLYLEDSGGAGETDGGQVGEVWVCAVCWECFRDARGCFGRWSGNGVSLVAFPDDYSSGEHSAWYGLG
jgi:hypothetical protein